MRVLALLFVLVVSAVGLVAAVPVLGVGCQDDPDALDPAFRRKAIALLDRAAAAADVTYEIRETSRAAWRQDVLFQLSRLPLMQMTKVPASRACHVPKDGWSGARAIDVTALGSSSANRTFYLHLKNNAARSGLRTGAGFGARNAGEVGWDPGHLELSGCTRG